MRNLLHKTTPIWQSMPRPKIEAITNQHLNWGWASKELGAIQRNAEQVQQSILEMGLRFARQNALAPLLARPHRCSSFRRAGCGGRGVRWPPFRGPGAVWLWGQRPFVGQGFVGHPRPSRGWPTNPHAKQLPHPIEPVGVRWDVVVATQPPAIEGAGAPKAIEGEANEPPTHAKQLPLIR